MKIVIAGGGIGGLVTALALHELGIDAEVYEQSRELRELGVGINLQPHAVKELASLGLLPALDAAGIRTRELVYTNRLGQTGWQELLGIDAGHTRPQFSSSGLVCRRHHVRWTENQTDMMEGELGIWLVANFGPPSGDHGGSI